MKVDAPFPQAPVVAPPARPVPQTTEQASARPVDRPHHDEAAENRPRREEIPAGDSRRLAPSGDSDEGHSASASHDDSASVQQQTQTRNPTEPARVGELLDVLA